MIHFSTHRPLCSFLLCTIFVLCFVVFIPQVKLVNNVDYFSLEDEDAEFHQKFKALFGGDEFFIIALEKENVFTADNLRVIREVTDALEALPDIRQVRSLTNITDLIGEEDSFEVRQLIEEIPVGAQALSDLRKRALSKPLYLNTIVSKDGRVAGILVFPYDRPHDDDYRKHLLVTTEQILAPYRQAGHQFHLAGLTTINYGLSRIMQRDMWVFFPLSALLIIVTVQLLFRNWWMTLLASVGIGSCVATMFGLFGLCGVRFNNLTCVVLPIAISLALADAVHIFSHLEKKELEGDEPDFIVLERILNIVVKPCLLTSLTTALGFLSVMVSSLPAMRDFAFMASASTVFEFLFSFFMLPPLILFVGVHRVFCDFITIRRGPSLTGLFTSLWGFIVRNRAAILITSLGLALSGAWFMTKVLVETDILGYFKPSNPVHREITFLEERMGGVATLDISLEAPEPDGFKEPANLRTLDELGKFAKGLEGVDHVTSFADFIKEMNQAFHAEDPAYERLPDSRDAVEQYLLLYDSDETDDFITPDYRHARIALRLSSHNTRNQRQVIDELRRYIAQSHASSELSIRLTGHAVNYVNVANLMVDNQIWSFATAVLTIGFVMIVSLRSLSIGLLSLVPNFFPIFLNFGLMGLFRIPLDTGTVMIAAVALGIACDDTIHFLSRYLDLRKQGVSIMQALPQVISSQGRAIFANSVILTVGFGVLTFGSFVPVMHFGILSTIIMAIAMWADVLMLPALMICNVRIGADDL
ncbi:MAG: MMPL family transporter [Deltaproteobacteria bacterium]|nr:MMPL family transporter [Deltaproteobacteria bacterium]